MDLDEVRARFLEALEDPKHPVWERVYDRIISALHAHDEHRRRGEKLGHFVTVCSCGHAPRAHGPARLDEELHRRCMWCDCEEYGLQPPAQQDQQHEHQEDDEQNGGGVHDHS